jgi:hypothetical protein
VFPRVDREGGPTYPVEMRNVTLAIDAELLKASREYAKARRTSLNALIRDLLAREVGRGDTAWLDELRELPTGDSGGASWTRDELHERPGRPQR